MIRKGTFSIGVVTFSLLVVCQLLTASDTHAQAMADYTTSPPFMNEAVPPNILLLLDNSGSMNNLAYKSAAFDTSKEYFGLFDPLECYTYASNKFQPNPAANPSTPGTCDTSYPWSGSLLNYVSMRRIDIVKWVMMGGTCSVGGRDASGGCRQLLGQSTFDNGACCADQVVSITAAQATGRMPSSQAPSSGNAYFFSMGSIASLKGEICILHGSSTPSSPSAENDCVEDTSWQVRVDTFADSSGIIQQVGSKARFGLMEFKGSGDGGKVLADVGTTSTSMVTAIEATTPSTWTPLGESLYEAVRYYAQIAPAYTNSDYTYNVTNRDPYYFQQPTWASTSQYVKCCKSFVIIFTDGAPTQDLNVPDSIKDYAHTALSHGTSAHCSGAAGCTSSLGAGTGSPPKHSDTSSANHTALTDHHDNCSSSLGGPTGDSCASNGSHYLDDVAYFAHTVDLRQGTIPVLNETGKALDGDQKLTIYTFFAFGSSDLLKNAAKAGGFEDRNGNNLPDLAEEYDRVNNNTGAAGADGVPDTYFESDDADKLKDRLMAAITSILQRAASGTSISVLATSSTGEGALYQSYFFPTTFEGLNEVKWAGYTQGLFVDSFGNMREDTNGDGKLTLVADRIIRTRYDSATGEVKLDRYTDSDGDGKADGSPTTLTLKDIAPIWEAGKQLALTDPADRTILTWVDTDNDGAVDSGEQIAFTTSNSSTLSPYLRPGASPFTADNIINFIRGTQISGLRNRELTVSGALKVWKLGDPVHSTPTIVGAPRERYDIIYGDSSYTDYFTKYKDRRQIAYLGANDGMLHAINAGFYHRGDDATTTSVTEHGWFTKNASDNSSGAALGSEKWGFIPYQLLPHLRWLTDTTYTHVYYVDLKPKVTDARIFTADTDHPNGWGTILIGGMRMGGSCGNCVASTGAPPMTVTADFGSGSATTRTFYTAYFALDITNPETEPKLLWSFTNSSLGLSTSYPTIVRVSPKCATCTKTDNTDAKWYMIIGSGPTGYDAASSQEGKIFVVDLKTGALVTTYATGELKTMMGHGLTVDSDLDYRVDGLYMGTVTDSNSTPKWTGKMLRLTTGGCTSAPCTTSTWGGTPAAPTVLLSAFPSAGTTKPGAMVAAPTVTMDDSNNLWLFFGTGRYFGVADKTNVETQYFFGVKDPVLTGGCTQSSATNCEKKNLLNVSGVTVCVACATGTNQVSGITGVDTLEGTSSNTLQGKIQGMDGWYTTLCDDATCTTPKGERAMNSPVILGGIVLFPTFTPTADPCQASGTGSLYALFYLTGSAYKESVIGTETSGSNTNVKRKASVGEGLPSQMAVQIGSQGSDGNGTGSGGGCTGQVTLLSQSSTGATSQMCGKVKQAWSHYISWINQRD